MSRPTPDAESGAMPERDAVLGRALAHMPDAHMQAGGASRSAVLAAARAAVAPPAPAAPAAGLWQRFAGRVWVMPQGATTAMATVAVATLSYLVWHDQSVPEIEPPVQYKTPNASVAPAASAAPAAPATAAVADRATPAPAAAGAPLAAPPAAKPQATAPTAQAEKRNEKTPISPEKPAQAATKSIAIQSQDQREEARPALALSPSPSPAAAAAPEPEPSSALKAAVRPPVAPAAPPPPPPPPPAPPPAPMRPPSPAPMRPLSPAAARMAEPAAAPPRGAAQPDAVAERASQRGPERNALHTSFWPSDLEGAEDARVTVQMGDSTVTLSGPAQERVRAMLERTRASSTNSSSDGNAPAVVPPAGSGAQTITIRWVTASASAAVQLAPPQVRRSGAGLPTAVAHWSPEAHAAFHRALLQAIAP